MVGMSFGTSVRRALPVAATAGLLVVAGCTPGGSDVEPSTVPTTRRPSPTLTPSPPLPTPTATRLPGPVAPAAVDEVATGLAAPWGLAFLPDGSALVSGRDDASIVHVMPGEVTPVGTVPDVDHGGEGGLLGLAIDPASPSTLYAYATIGGENRVLRTTYTADGLGTFETVLDGIPAAGNHNGGRLVFGPDGMLYVSTGDAGDTGNAQDLGSLGGKILRITPDGGVPPDNPFDGSLVFSYGHRNVQGLAFDDAGRLWASEFGQDTWDELNLVEAGANHGWPIVEGEGGAPDFADPVAVWRTDDASPSGIAYVRDTIFMAGLRGERLWRIPVPDGVAGDPQSFLDGEYGRLRLAAAAPDGTLWVLTNNTDGRGDPSEGDDRILRITLEPA